MIQSFADKTTENIFHGIHTHSIHKDFQTSLLVTAERKLDILNSAQTLDELIQIPSMKAVRDAHGKYSVPIDDQWRICFRWNDAPEDVEMKNF